jgi:ABC-type sugar transport system permease subunit
VSSTAVPTPAPSRLESASAAFRSAPSRAIAFFSGPVGLAVKIGLLALVNALAVWAAILLATDHKWVALAVLIASTVIIDAVYLSPRAYPAKFLIPGTVFLLAFQVIPILYTINVAFDKYSTGHVSSKANAVEAIQQNSLSEIAAGTAYTMAVARDDSGKLVLVLVDQDTGKTYVGDKEGLKPLPQDSVATNADGTITSATGYKLVTGNQLFQLDRTISSYSVPVGDQGAIRPQGLDTAVVLKPTLRYDPKADTFTRISDGAVYRDNGKGSFVTAAGEELEPGWRARVGFANFDRLIHDPLIRKPFVRVFIWTFAFAVSTVLISFALGLLLAIALDKKGMRGQRLYRSVLVIPYAIPGLLSILVWSGLLNDRFGVVNQAFHINVPWLFDPNWAKVSVILVSVWLTFPYFFLVSMGALQSVPAELYEAARVDGGGGWQVFRKVTLPLLLIAVAPLMIASFAFNFNNFNNIYLLTAGGPAMNEGSVAGSTDILISYTYKLAIATGKGQDFGLAAAITIIIFLIVATISAISFSKTKALENLA